MHKRTLLASTFLSVSLLASCSDSDSEPPAGQANGEIEYVAVLSSLATDSGVESIPVAINADFYQLSTRQDLQSALTKVIGLPEQNCIYESVETLEIPWRLGEIQVADASLISVGNGLSVENNLDQVANLTPSTLGRYEIPVNSSQIDDIDRTHPSISLQRADTTLTLTPAEFPAGLSVDLELPVLKEFYRVFTITAGDYWQYVKGTVPDFYTLDFSFEWLISESNFDNVFIQAWTDKGDGSHGVMSCYLANADSFSVPTEIQEQARDDGLSYFDNIYIARALYDTSVVDNVLLVRTAEHVRGIWGSRYPEL